MRWVTDLHNKHKDNPIWIVGSDPTLDNYGDDYLDNKIGITLHLAYFKFPNATYRFFNELDRIQYCLEQDPSIIDKTNIFAYPFYAKGVAESSAVMGKDNYFFKINPYPPNGDREDILTKIGISTMIKQVDQAIEGKTITFGGYWTCLHNAFYMAILMGASVINILACGHKTIKGKDHYGEQHEVDRKLRPWQVPFSADRRCEHMTVGTLAIIEGCKKHGIEVNWIKT